MISTRVLVCGAGGFIGGHLVKRLKAEGYWVRGADIKSHEFAKTAADEFILGDLRDQAVARAISQIDNPKLAALHASRSKNG